MRSLIAMLVAAVILIGVYYYHFQKMPATDAGTSPTQAISLTGVRSDLLQIAQAERAFIAANGQCASLQELQSTNSLSMSRSERDGYAYAVQCSGGEFEIRARHAPAPAGSPIRYPNLNIDALMQIHEIE